MLSGSDDVMCLGILKLAPKSFSTGSLGGGMRLWRKAMMAFDSSVLLVMTGNAALHRDEMTQLHYPQNVFSLETS